jgi:cytoskeletal protein RodZ
VRKTKRSDEVPPLVAIGRCLASARKRRRMTLERLSEKTKISSRYIAHIEAGDFGLLPARIYVINFTKTICISLGVDHEKVIEAVKSELYSSIQNNVDEQVQKNTFQKKLKRFFASK